MSDGITTSSKPEKEALRAVSEEAVPPSFEEKYAHPVRDHWAKRKRAAMRAKDPVFFICITS
jgi:hypothetical protein